MGVINANNVKTVVSVIIIVVLLLIILNHFFRDLFRLNPFYRNKILLEGFDASGNTVAAPSATATPSATTTATATATATTPIEDTDKSTMMADLFEKVNNQTDMIRTIKLSDKFTPINIDKTASEPFVILMNLKLLINNGVYKNEMDLNELYDKYIGNKAVQLLVSDINSVNMDTGSIPDIGSLETQYLTRCKSIVDGHQKIIDKILENKSKENNL
jgi:hypothetical protein